MWPIPQPRVIEQTRPLVHLIMDLLKRMRDTRAEASASAELALKYECDMPLPSYAVEVGEAYAARVCDCFRESSGETLSVREILDGEDLKRLPARQCAPFTLGDRHEIPVTVDGCPGRSYKMWLVISTRHLGETIMCEKPLAVIEPKVSICAMPNPNYAPIDERRIVWQALINGYRQHVERLRNQLAKAAETDVPVPNNPVISAGLIAIHNGGPNARSLVGGWCEEASGGPIYRYQHRQTLLVYPTLEPSYQLDLVDALWRFVEGFRQDTADVALAVLALMCTPKDGSTPVTALLDPVIITDQEIADYLCPDRKTGLSHHIYNRIHAAMEQLQALSFDVDFSKTSRPGARDGLSWKGDRLFDIVNVEHLQYDLFGERTSLALAWAVRAGMWAYYWFNPKTLRYVGKMSRASLALDSRRGRSLVRKIGQRLLLLSQVSRQRGKVSILVSTLLSDIGELLSPEKRTHSWASTIRDALESAIAELLELNIFRQVEWPDGGGPQDIDRNKGWTDRWLNSRIFVRVSDNTNPSRTKLTWLTERPRSRPITDLIRIIRTNAANPMLQATVAKTLGVSRPYLSLIESGRKRPSKKLRLAIIKWAEEVVRISKRTGEGLPESCQLLLKASEDVIATPARRPQRSVRRRPRSASIDLPEAKRDTSIGSAI